MIRDLLTTGRHHDSCKQPVFVSPPVFHVVATYSLVAQKHERAERKSEETHRQAHILNIITPCMCANYQPLLLISCLKCLFCLLYFAVCIVVELCSETYFESVDLWNLIMISILLNNRLQRWYYIYIHTPKAILFLGWGEFSTLWVYRNSGKGCAILRMRPLRGISQRHYYKRTHLPH